MQQTNQDHQYFILWYRLANVDSYLIWYSKDTDGVVLNKFGKISIFSSPAKLRSYADKSGLTIEESEPVLHHLDSVEQWLASPKKTSVDCVEFLNAWNLFSDVLSTIDNKESRIDDQKQNDLYCKLFHGNNLPAFKTDGPDYKPTWTKSEVDRLYSVLSRGMKLFRSSISSK